MASVRQHYDQLLASRYLWMAGGWDAKIADGRAFFQTHGVKPQGAAVAVDLGAGCGFQSIPLAESGFSVIAVDMNRSLLAQLKQKAGRLPIVAVEDDLLNFRTHAPPTVELIVCMGDTLTHLDSFKQVAKMIGQSFQALDGNGRLILNFRDFTQELKGLQRFIPVRSDSKRIFTCFLEYEKESVRVHDIVYEKNAGQWTLKKSFFRKLRLCPRWTEQCLKQTGFRIEAHEDQKAMVTIVARKPHTDRSGTV